jgi:3-oxoacyl-[acyl-carrier-protein] synthase II
MESVILPTTVRAITSGGATWRESWNSLVDCRRSFGMASQVLSSIPDGPPVALIPPRAWPAKSPSLPDRLSLLIEVLASGLKADLHAASHVSATAQVGAVIATSHGDSGAISEIVDSQVADEPVTDAAWRGLLLEGTAAALSQGLGMTVPTACLSAACASSLVALGFARDQIESGVWDACVVLGADVLSRVAVVGFRQVGAMSRLGCRPFHAKRDGTTVGEAGVAMLMTSSDVAAHLMARFPERFSSHAPVAVKGYGLNCDARHSVEPSRDGIATAMSRALEQASVRARDIAGVYWHGTGTIQNDAAEAAAAEMLFASYPPPGTSPKGVFGHAMGASGLLSVAAACETLHSRLLPPTHSLDEQAFPDMQIVCAKPRTVQPGPVLAVSLGFGGLNSAVVLTLSDAVGGNG